MPSRCALVFILSANLSIDPATPSARATAMSFAECTIIILSALSTVTVVPTGKPIFVGAWPVALADTVNGESSVMRAFLDGAQRRVKRHQFRDGRRIPRIGRVLGVEHLAAPRRSAALPRHRRGAAGQAADREKTQSQANGRQTGNSQWTVLGAIRASGAGPRNG